MDPVSPLFRMQELRQVTKVVVAVKGAVVGIVITRPVSYIYIAGTDSASRGDGST
jgi:hypothetical protein